MTESDIQKLFRNYRFVVYAIIFFLIFITVLIVVVARQLTSEQAFQTQSQASEVNIAARMAQDMARQNLIPNETIPMDNNAFTDTSALTDASSCSESVMATSYRARWDINGSEIIGCKANVYCDKNRPLKFAGNVECAYSGTLRDKRDFKSNLCNHSECHAKALQVCGCVERPSDPGSAGTIEPTATPTPVAVAGSCEATVRIDNVQRNRDTSGKCGGLVNTKQSVAISCRKPDGTSAGTRVYCNIKDGKNRCIDPNKLSTDLLKRACCGCTSAGYYHIDIDSDLTP